MLEWVQLFIMMKKLSYLFIFLLLTSFTYTSPKQKINRIIYKIGFAEKLDLTKDLDKDAKDKKDQMLYNYMSSMEKSMTEVEFELLFNQKIGVYKTADNVKEQNIGYKLASMFFGGESIYTYDIQQQQVIMQANMTGQVIDVAYPTYNWEITNETKKIGDYTCYKATTSYQEFSYFKEPRDTVDIKLEAWFTPEIAAPYGPMHYQGLPGLVLMAQASGAKIYIYADRIELNKKSKKPITFSKSEKQLPLNEYNKLLEKQRLIRSN